MRSEAPAPDPTEEIVSTGSRSYKVLMIAPTSFFASYGCHVRILEEARILQRQGHRVTIATYHNGQDVEGLDIERTLPIPWRRDYEVGSSRHKMGFDLLLGLKCASMLGQRPDVIHAHLHEGVFIGYPLGLLWGVPVVFDFQGSMTSEMLDHRFLNRESSAFRLWSRLEALLIRFPQAIITSSRHAARLLQDRFGCAPERVTPIPDCVDIDFFAPTRSADEVADLKRRWRIPPQRIVVAYLGLLAEHQGTRLLLDAAAELLKVRSDVHFLIMGYPGVDHYRREARKRGLGEHVTFTGRVDYPGDAARFLAMGDLTVAPKMSATEGSGKLLNYMSMGRPVIAFDTPVSREYLGEHGVYAPMGNASAFAERMVQVLAMPDCGLEMGRRLRQRARERYSWEWAGRQIGRVYDHVVSENRGRG
jgi:glycosyltransferase involved in cell wall biosynthesis